MSNVYQPKRTVSDWDRNVMYEKAPMCHSDGIYLNDYEIVKYVSGDAMLDGKHLTWSMFDSLTMIGKSENPRKKTQFYTFHGYRQNDKSQTILICKKKENV